MNSNNHKNKKRIAFVMDSMAVGGVERALIELLNNFDYSNYSVTVFLCDMNGELQSMLPNNIEISCYRNTNTAEILKRDIVKFKLISVVKGLIYRFLARININEYDLNAYYSSACLPLCDKTEYDCVVAYQILSPKVVATALKRIKGKKKVLFVHGRNVRPNHLNHFFDLVYGKFDMVYCVSNQTRIDYIRDFPISGRKASVFYNLLDSNNVLLRSAECPDINFLRENRYKLVTVGRLVSIKGQQMIPATVRLLLNAGYDVHWYIVGDGPLRDEIECEIDKYDIAEYVHLLGTQMNPYPYIKNCDIYVQPSFSEGYCTTTVEAKILQKPIVTTDAPGMREQFVSGENGLIVDAMTPKALFDGIKTLIDHPEMREKFVENLKNEGYDNSKELQKLYDFIES